MSRKSAFYRQWRIRRKIKRLQSFGIDGYAKVRLPLQSIPSDSTPRSLPTLILKSPGEHSSGKQRGRTLSPLCNSSRRRQSGAAFPTSIIHAADAGQAVRIRMLGGFVNLRDNDFFEYPHLRISTRSNFMPACVSASTSSSTEPSPVIHVILQPLK